MNYCLNDKLKREIAEAFGTTFKLAMQAERNTTQSPTVPVSRQLYLAQLVARSINETYYKNLPDLWVPSISVGLAIVHHEEVIVIDIQAIHKCAFGLWN